MRSRILIVSYFSALKDYEKETSKGIFYDIEIELTGKNFGSKKGKVYFEYTDPVKSRTKKKMFKMFNQTFDIETGESTFTGLAKMIPADYKECAKRSWRRQTGLLDRYLRCSIALSEFFGL